MNTRSRCLVVLLLACLLGAPALLLSQSASARFEQGLLKENAEGTLDEAIVIFKGIVEDKAADPAIRAKAQLHVGICYEKLGLEKAREAFEQVIRNYPGEAATVAMAREKLDGLLRPSALARKGDRELTIRKITTPPGQDVLGRVSADGRYLVDVGGGTCNLWVLELATGKQRHVTPPDKDCSLGSPYGPRWSPDSTKLVFTWRNPAGVRDLRVAPLDGSAPRILLAGGAWGMVEALDWTPDGRQVLAAAYYAEREELSVIDVADGSVRPLRTFEAGAVLDGRFAPDGRHLAYSRRVGTSSDGVRTRDVFLLAVDERREIPIVQHPADDAFLEWLPGGQSLLFGTDRAGSYDLWSVEVGRAGESRGAPALVRRSMGPVTPLGLTTDGAFYYRTPASFMDVYTVDLDPVTGAVVGPLKREPLPWEGHNRWPDWSPDGRQLAYVCVRPTVVGPFQPGRARRWIVSTYSFDTGQVREYPNEQILGLPRWSRDGRGLYLVGLPSGAYRMAVQSGELTPLPGGRGPLLRVSPDQKWILYGRNSRIVLRDAMSGEERELDSRGVGPGGLALSSDGGRLAWIEHDEDAKTTVLKVMPFPDGTPTEIQRLRESGGQIAWSSDGRFIFFSDLHSAQGSDWHLWRVPADGGSARDLGTIPPGHEELRVHPGGSRVTFAAPTINPERSQVWVMENFLPAAKEAGAASAQKVKK